MLSFPLSTRQDTHAISDIHFGPSESKLEVQSWDGGDGEMDPTGDYGRIHLPCLPKRAPGELRPLGVPAIELLESLAPRLACGRYLPSQVLAKVVGVLWGG